MTKHTSAPRVPRARRIVRAEPTSVAVTAQVEAPVAASPTASNVEAKLTQAVQALAQEQVRLEPPVPADSGHASVQILDQGVFSDQDRSLGITDGRVVTLTLPDGVVLRWAVLTINGDFHIGGGAAVSGAGHRDVPEVGIDIALRNAKHNLAQRRARMGASLTRMKGPF